MTIQEAITVRHSVRSYLDKPIPADMIAALTAEIGRCNTESGLHIQAVWNEPKAFGGLAAHYGRFTGVRNYLALIGPKASDLEEKVGYYGEQLVLKAQMRGLNTCWVAGTFGKRTAKEACRVEQNEKLVCVIALGYGAAQGVSHCSKSLETLCACEGVMPDWFKAGMEAARLAPTAVNQQKFKITLAGNAATAKALIGPFSKIDLGIVKYHFEVGSGKGRAVWQTEGTRQ